ncbi:hypothetical protein Tco_0596231 [Tanacetum coccineum]
MNRGFLDSRGRKNNHRKKTITDTSTGSVMKLDGTLNDDTLVAKEVVSPSVVDEIMAKEKQRLRRAMPKIIEEEYYTCNIHVEYEWKPLRCACCKIFGHVQEECPKNIVRDEDASVDNQMANFLAKKDGYGTQSLLEQWTDSYENDDYGYDPYDDDMYEGQDIPNKLQAICDKLDITVRGRRKK